MNSLTESWKDKLRADPIPWLLEHDNPPVRYFTRIELLDLPQTDKEVLESK